MDVWDVGMWRFCPACGRPVEDQVSPTELEDRGPLEWQEPRCTGCGRPWIACPCEPEG